MKNSCYFYRDLKPLLTFPESIQTQLHFTLPDDWWVVVADVVDSTKAIQDGDYKKVNTVGVACIAAVTNVNKEIDIPFVFGGDGASFAIPGNLVDAVILALRGTQKLARESFGLDLRVGLVNVGNLGKDHLAVKVAKVRLSAHLNYASFSGSGWEEADRRVKAEGSSGVVRVNVGDGVAEANFEGFECRWHGVPNFNGHKLSLLVAAMAVDTSANHEIYQDVFNKLHNIYGDVADYHPLRSRLMHLTLNPRLLSHEWRVRSGRLNVLERFIYFMKLLFLGVVGKWLFSGNLDTETVKWSHYRDELVENTDFRKFDGMLRMVIDGSDAQASELEEFLASRFHARQLVYGMHKSSEALVTCLVQSYTGNHLHLVDGGDGGYAMAAQGLKRRLAAFKR